MISKRTKNIISKTLMAVMLSSMTLNGVSQIAYAQEVTQENVHESTPLVEHADDEIVAESEWEGQTWLYEAVKSQMNNKAISSVTYGDLLKVKKLSYKNYDNKFTGIIPSFIGNFKNLEYITINNAGLTGTIPEEIYNLTNLTTLVIMSTGLGGEISPKVGNLINLGELNFSKNRLTGSIPEEIYNLTNVEILKLSNNKFKNNTIANITVLPKLVTLELENCDISGELPTNLGEFPKLKNILLSNNNITGNIPPNISTLKSLNQLTMANNKLQGNIPKELFDSNIQYLNLNSNNLTGDLPSNMFAKPRYELSLGDNNLTGIITTGQYVNEVRTFDVRNNNLTGTIPSNLACNQTQAIVYLQNNNFIGELPKGTFNTYRLKIDTSNNKFIGDPSPQTRSSDFVNKKGNYLDSLSEDYNKLTNIRVKASANEEVTIAQPIEGLSGFYDYDVEEKDGYYIMKQDGDKLTLKPTREGIMNIKVAVNLNEWGLEPYNGLIRNIKLEVDAEHNRTLIKLPQILKFEEFTDLESKVSKYLKEYINNPEVKLEVKVKNGSAYVTAMDSEDYHCNYYNSKIKKNVLVQDIKIPIEEGIQEEIEDNSEQLQLEQQAKDAVAKAESTKKQEDIDTARKLVDKLKNKTLKSELIVRLDTIKSIEDDEKEKETLAIASVEKAESSRKQEDINKAKDLANQLDNSTLKAELINRLEAIKSIEEENKEGLEKQIQEAQSALDRAKQTKEEKNIDRASQLINELPSCKEKDNLRSELDKLILDINNEKDEESKIKEATKAVIKAESSCKYGDINTAKILVNTLKISGTKTDLLGRIEAIERLCAEKLEQAKLALEKAELSRTKADIEIAKDTISQLPNIEDRTPLYDRLNKIFTLEDEMAEVTKAEKAVAKAEKTRRDADRDEAYNVVDSIRNSDKKLEFYDRLKAIETIEDIYSKREQAVELLVQKAELSKSMVDVEHARNEMYKLPIEFRLMNKKNYRLDTLELIDRLKSIEKAVNTNTIPGPRDKVSTRNLVANIEAFSNLTEAEVEDLILNAEKSLNIGDIDSARKELFNLNLSQQPMNDKALRLDIADLRIRTMTYIENKQKDPDTSSEAKDKLNDLEDIVNNIVKDGKIDDIQDKLIDVVDAVKDVDEDIVDGITITDGSEKPELIESIPDTDEGNGSENGNGSTGGNTDNGSSNNGNSNGSDNGSGNSSSGSSGSNETVTPPSTKPNEEKTDKTVIKTTFELADELKIDGKLKSVIITTNQDFADALTATPLAAKEKAPILYVGPGATSDTLNYVKSSLKENGKIFIIGETGAISKDIESKLQSISNSVIRLGGKDRYETNEKILEQINITEKTPLYVTSGLDFADAVTVSSKAIQNEGAIILTQKDATSKTLKQYLDKSKNQEVVIVGGLGVISDKVEKDLNNTGKLVIRLGGEDRYMTSIKVANSMEPKKAYVVKGTDFKESINYGLKAGLEKASVVYGDKDSKELEEFLKNQTTITRTFIK